MDKIDLLWAYYTLFTRFWQTRTFHDQYLFTLCSQRTLVRCLRAQASVESR